jgi:hypothetical protein
MGPEVLDTFRPSVEPESVADKDAPVRACARYISNRTDFLDYQGALAAGLPIGLGEIESAHRYIIQSRLKRAGAWWTMDNLEHMLALRVLGPTESGTITGARSISRPRNLTRTLIAPRAAVAKCRSSEVN